MKCAASRSPNAFSRKFPTHVPIPCTFIGNSNSVGRKRQRLVNHYSYTDRTFLPVSKSNRDPSSYSSLKSLKEPDETDSNFGRMEYWNNCYEDEDDFTWYAEWNDIQPFFSELVPLHVPLNEKIDAKDSSSDKAQLARPRVLLPGIGNDKSMVDMFDYGYSHLTAYDYAPEGIESAKRFFGERDCDLRVADARDLPYKDDSFDAVLEKGTLDAIYLSGASDKGLASRHLDMAVEEMARTVKKGGVVMSITAACAGAVRESFGKDKDTWRVVRDGDFYVTDDGYTSNNIDATIFAWERL